MEQTQLFYSTRSENDCVYGPELNERSGNGRLLRCHVHDSDRRGFLSADILEKRAGGLTDKTFYLCGPTPLMQGLTKQLLAKGVPKDRIVFESFSY